MNIQAPVRPLCLCAAPLLPFLRSFFFIEQIQLVLFAALEIKQFPLWH